MSIPALIPPLSPWILPLTLILLPILLTLSTTSKRRHLPPGPRPIPFLGNLLSLPPKNLYLYLSTLSRTYGGLLTIWMGQKPVLVISSPEIAYELLEKRGNKYSSRPRAPVFGELFSRNNALVVTPFGREWVLRRKLLHNSLKKEALKTYQPHQEAEASLFLLSLLHNPSSWSQQISRYAASIIFILSFSHRTASLSSPTTAQRFANLAQQNDLARPGKFLADTFPFLIHLPEFLAPWKKRVREMGDEEARFNIGLVERVREERKERGGRGGRGSFVDMLIEKQEFDPEGMKSLDARAMATLPATLFSGGVDTTVSTIHSAFLLFLLHPEVLAIARAEIDTHLSNSTSQPTDRKSPRFEDLEKLPYFQATVQEILRLRPAIPLMIPRATTARDTYLDYAIPEATTLFVNTYAMHFDEAYFSFPGEFKPQRFLEEGHVLFEEKYRGKKTFPGRREKHGAFGWGRRSCPGAELAVNVISSLLAKVVWGFELLGVEGEALEGIEYEGGAIQKPGAFGCVFKVRSEAHREVIEREGKWAEEVLREFEAW